MHNLCVFCTFCAFAQKIFKGWGCNFTWNFGKVIHIKSLKMVFVARIIRHKLCMIFAFFDFFVQKSFLTKNYFLTVEINLITRSPLYTCLFSQKIRFENSYNKTSIQWTLGSWIYPSKIASSLSIIFRQKHFLVKKTFGYRTFC